MSLHNWCRPYFSCRLVFSVLWCHLGKYCWRTYKKMIWWSQI